MSGEQLMRKHRRSGNRAVLRRMRFIVQELLRGKTTLEKIAADYECSTKTIDRDIEFLRDELGLPIHSEHYVGTWMECTDTLCPLCLGRKDHHE